jgi:hypothetical protein
LNDAPATIAIAAVYERTARKYKQRAERYVHMEVGHAAQNVHLQAVALDLGTVVVGAFDDAEVKRVLTLALNEEPMCLMPVGKPRPQLQPGVRNVVAPTMPRRALLPRSCSPRPTPRGSRNRVDAAEARLTVRRAQVHPAAINRHHLCRPGPAGARGER